ncbi:hypothetical protein TNCV_207841 [Trichonephila clavipes]|nr:hypothetical protein TNCV_207841 [Trichonephila clavipes]
MKWTGPVVRRDEDRTSKKSSMPNKLAHGEKGSQNLELIDGVEKDVLVLRTKNSDEAPFWLNGYVNKQNCRIWSEANPQVYVETPLHPEKLTVWCALWAGGILLPKR